MGLGDILFALRKLRDRIIGALLKRQATEEYRTLLDTQAHDAVREDVQNSLYVRQRIERARREIEQGRLIDHVEIEQRMKDWLRESLPYTQ